MGLGYAYGSTSNGTMPAGAIGITGGISTGKTTFVNCLRELLPEAKFFDADAMARELTHHDQAVLAEIRDKFGNDIFDTNGQLNRSALRAMVFQALIPVGIGLLFTDWELNWHAVLSIGLGLGGGLLAYESLHLSRRFKLPAVIGWFALYAGFIVAVVASA